MREQAMNATIQRAVTIPDKPCFSDWTVGSNERGDSIRSIVKFGQSHLRVHAGAGAADGWLLVAHGAAIPVECRTKSAAIFTFYIAGDGLHFLELHERLVEESLCFGFQIG